MNVLLNSCAISVLLLVLSSGGECQKTGEHRGIGCTRAKTKEGRDVDASHPLLYVNGTHRGKISLQTSSSSDNGVHSEGLLLRARFGNKTKEDPQTHVEVPKGHWYTVGVSKQAPVLECHYQRREANATDSNTTESNTTTATISSTSSSPDATPDRRRIVCARAKDKQGRWVDLSHPLRVYNGTDKIDVLLHEHASRSNRRSSNSKSADTNDPGTNVKMQFGTMTQADYKTHMRIPEGHWYVVKVNNGSVEVQKCHVKRAAGVPFVRKTTTPRPTTTTTTLTTTAEPTSSSTPCPVCPVVHCPSSDTTRGRRHHRVQETTTPAVEIPPRGVTKYFDKGRGEGQDQPRVMRLQAHAPGATGARSGGADGTCSCERRVMMLVGMVVALVVLLLVLMVVWTHGFYKRTETLVAAEKAMRGDPSRTPLTTSDV